jgi:hypothetical protein
VDFLNGGKSQELGQNRKKGMRGKHEAAKIRCLRSEAKRVESPSQSGILLQLSLLLFIFRGHREKPRPLLVGRPQRSGSRLLVEHGEKSANRAPRPLIL